MHGTICYNFRACAFHITKQKLELLVDPNMIEFFLSDAIRGGNELSKLRSFYGM